MVFRKKRGMRKRPMRRRATKKVSKPLRRAIKQVVKSQAETKVINVPTTGSLVVNTVNLPYPALSGIQYLASDIFAVPQGTQNDTGIGSLNRIGDKINALGFQMNYYFSTAAIYSLASAVYMIPYIKLRVTVFEAKYGVPAPSTPLTYDGNYLSTNTSTLQPINYDAGFVRKVLHDRVYIIRNQNAPQQNGGTLPILPTNNVFHFQKYFKYNKLVSSVDNPNPSGTATKNPIYIAIAAELDDAQTGIVPSGTKILFTTGYTRCWFKDS